MHPRCRNIQWTRPAGFTLLEVTVALGVFGLLVAGAFGLAGGSIELIREVSDFETRELARIRFVQLCRATFRELPGTARFRLGELEGPVVAGAGPGKSQILRVTGHPRAFPVGLAGSAGEAFASLLPEVTVLSSRPDGAGGLMIRLHHLAGEDALRFEEEPVLEGLKAESLTLLRGIRQVRWRFYDARAEEWLEIWEEDGRRPRFVELTLQLLGDQRPYRSVFWVPDAHLPADFQPALEASPPAAGGPPGSSLPVDAPAGAAPGPANGPVLQIESPPPGGAAP